MVTHSTRGHVANVCVWARGSGDWVESGQEVEAEKDGHFWTRVESLSFETDQTDPYPW